MRDFIKQAAPYIFVAIVAFLVGTFVALNHKSDSSIYFDAKFGKDAGFTIGRNSITDHDLSAIGKNEAALLSSRIRELGYFDHFSIELRNLRDLAVGPFQEHDIEILVKFTDDNISNGDLAQACRGEVLFTELNVFQIVAPAQTHMNINRMRDFKVLLEKEKSFCASSDIDSKTIWINAEVGRNWLRIEDGNLPLELRAKANIVRTIMYRDDGSMTTSSEKPADVNET